MAQITLRDYLQQTEDAISSSRVDDALTHCQFMLSYFPEALEIQRMLGEVYLAQGRMEEAQQLFDWVLTNDPENVLAYCNRAHLGEHIAEYDAALDCYQQAYELSRGNGQIREKFNRLSEKVGQKGFMFSRAGLARLYMRGDLLSEAMQEWEAILAVSPDRLDARVGLLETYWRAGQLESVEKLAEQILLHVPGCLKALLLQACVVATKNSQQAQELLGRAEALDPDQTTAQVLFADALASQPDDPFLQLLKKAPTLLPDASPLLQRQASFAPASDPVNALESSNGMDALALWGKDAYGGNDTTLVKPRPEPVAASSEIGTTSQWGQSNASLSSVPQPLATGARLQASQNAPTQEINNSQSSQQPLQGSQGHAPEPWELLQDALNQFDPIGLDPRTATGSQTVAYQEGVPLWDNTLGPVELSQPALDTSASASSLMAKPQESSALAGMKLDPWGTPMEESAREKPLPLVTEDLTPPPNWLSMLAQTDRTARGSEPAAFTLESQLNNRLPLANASLEQQVQPNARAAEMRDAGSSPPQQYTSSIGTSQTALEDVEAFPSWMHRTGASPVPTNEEMHRMGTSPVPPNEEKLEDEEESFFGPSWLKSLGATTMGEEEAVGSSASAFEVQAPQPGYRDLQHEGQTHAPLAQQSEALMQSPATEYQPAPTHSAVPETNSYELWSQSSGNNSPQTYEQTPWSSSEVTQQSGYTKHEGQPLHKDVYASSTYWSQASLDQPAERPGQQEKAPDKAEQHLLSTMEELEESLWSQGFVPMEPNSLATLATQTPDNSILAQDSGTSRASEAYNVQDNQPSTPWSEPQEAPETPSLSSALAQLGSFVKEPAPPAASAFEITEQSDEPSWLQALKNVSTPPIVAATPMWPDTSAEPSAPAAYTDNVGQPPAIKVEPTAVPVPNPIQPAAREPQQTGKAPIMRGNPLLDAEGELETTMRRPAVRLQSMQPYPSPAKRAEESLIVSRATSRERIEQASRVIKPAANDNLSYRERLVKGYQHQLVGDYDEAMQEYRIIIRSGTDLLNDVVSNVRALLKLAPNYSAGYRVLGDAYMRQGEYLQAMEAYNKALTMTKKVKSRT